MQCSTFVDKVGSFGKTTQALVDVLKTQADKIERELMVSCRSLLRAHCCRLFTVARFQAIGQRNRVETERESRKRRQQELQYLIAQRQTELQR